MSDREGGAAPSAGRADRLAEARDLLIAALEILDSYSLSPAPATVDLAIHQINGEIGR